MIYLVGVNHEIQYKQKTENKKAKEFGKYIFNVIKGNRISVIAEELSEEALKLNKCNESISRENSHKLKIEHKFCDPDTEERTKIGYPTIKQIKEELNLPKPKSVAEHKLQESLIKEKEKSYFPIRERFWLEKIKDRLKENILFICGDDHIESFSILLKSKSTKYKILSKNCWFF